MGKGTTEEKRGSVGPADAAVGEGGCQTGHEEDGLLDTHSGCGKDVG